MASTFSTAVALRGEQSGGALSVTDNTLPARWDGPPLHHHEFDEAFYVLAGEVTFQVRDELFAAGPGAVAFAPGGAIAHPRQTSATRRRATCCCARRPASRPTSAGWRPRPPARTRPHGRWRRRRRSPRSAGRSANVTTSPRRRRSRPPATTSTARRAGEQNDGRVGVMLNRMPPGATGPPLHHHAFDELFYVLEGELAFQVEDERIVRDPASSSSSRAACTRSPIAPIAPARFLIACTPAPS